MTVAMTCALAGCTTYQSLDPAELGRLEAVLRTGDEVRVVTRAGEQIDLTVSSIEANAIEGGGTRILVADVRTIEAKRLDKRRVWIVTGAIVGGALLLVDYDDDDCAQCFPILP